MNSFTDLEIYNLAFELALRIHKISLKMPKYELYEQGSQIRRSSKSIKDNIVEGFGRKRYKNEWVKFLTYSHSSCNEVISQLSMIHILYKIKEIPELLTNYDKLGRKINKFIQYVDLHWNNKNA